MNINIFIFPLKILKLKKLENFIILYIIFKYNIIFTCNTDIHIVSNHNNMYVIFNYI